MRRNDFPDEQVPQWFLLLSEKLSASNYPGAAYTPSRPIGSKKRVTLFLLIHAMKKISLKNYVPLDTLCKTRFISTAGSRDASNWVKDYCVKVKPWHSPPLGLYSFVPLPLNSQILLRHISNVLMRWKAPSATSPQVEISYHRHSCKCCVQETRR